MSSGRRKFLQESSGYHVPPNANPSSNSNKIRPSRVSYREENLCDKASHYLASCAGCGAAATVGYKLMLNITDEYDYWTCYPLKLKNYYKEVLNTVNTLLCFMTFYAVLVMIVGLIKKRPEFMTPYLILHAISTVEFLLGYVLCSYITSETDELAPYRKILAACHIAILVLIWFRWSQLKREKMLASLQNPIITVTDETMQY